MKGFILLEVVFALVLTSILAIAAAEVVTQTIAGAQRVEQELRQIQSVAAAQTLAHTLVLDGVVPAEAARTVRRRFPHLTVEIIEKEIRIWHQP